MDKLVPILYTAGIISIIYTIYNKDQIYDWLLSKELQKQTIFVEKENRYLKKNSFTFDRIIDGDCNGKALVMGMFSRKNKDEITIYQGIRWGEDGEIKALKSFVKDNNILIYTFEDNTILKIRKDDSSKIMYSYESPEKVMSDIVIRSFKPISMRGSEAIDAISELK